MKFYHIHVPKTGGMSLRHYGIDNNLEWDYEDGHKSFSERAIPQDAITITSLRCPIKQTISIYSFWKSGTPMYVPIKKMQPFSDWIRNPQDLEVEWPSGKWKWLPNLYVSFFGDGDFDKAVENIKSVDHILDTSNLTEQFNEKFVKKYNFPKFEKHINISKQMDISKDDLNYIKGLRKQDLEICKMFGIQTM